MSKIEWVVGDKYLTREGRRQQQSRTNFRIKRPSNTRQKNY